MDSIPEKLLKIKWLTEWHDPHVLDYIRTGSPEALQRIPALSNGGKWVIPGVLPPPPEWTKEADRVLRIAVNFELTSLISHWLETFCRHDGKKWDHFHAALDILNRNAADQTWRDPRLIKTNLIDSKTSHSTGAGPSLPGWNEGRPTTLHRCNSAHVTRPSDFDQFAVVLASRAPDRLDALLSSPWGQTLKEIDWVMILHVNPQRYHERGRAAYEKKSDHNPWLAHALAKAQPELYRDWAIAELWKVCGACPGEPCSREAIEFLLELDAPGTF